MDANAWTALASAAIALVALGFSFFTFRRQESRAERLARGNVRPYLDVGSRYFVDLKTISIANQGVGPAIIRRAIFTKCGTSTHRIVELFDLPGDFLWEFFAALQPGRAIRAQEEFVLVKQSLGHLESQGIPSEQGLQLLREFDQQQCGIQVRVEFEDILGNVMDVYECELLERGVRRP
jgi:hypothetical protein